MRARQLIFRWLLAAFLLSTLAGIYAWAYFAVPLLRCDKGGMQTVHMRCFARDFQPYFFAPAARIEALAIRIRRRLVPTTDFCGEVVQVCTTRVDLRFRATPDFPPIDAPLPYGTDILTFAEAHPPFGFFPTSPNTRETPDGTVLACKYLYCETDEAEEFLSGPTLLAASSGGTRRNATCKLGQTFWWCLPPAVIHAQRSCLSKRCGRTTCTCASWPLKR